ncbi:ABC transporter substrate-binding protein [Entomospira culicis]|uniref:Solute-binding protein family 5 domain-containing protein n=1 Tax=Entomospira culicis TaxID=2719989 RepID=A0A968GGH3_9SPIO|nr:ABC transporter substrate-binding protein [Entomospira culicis]NIZ18396.1 hypothetical protein [Entomospira culicis]NIZ68612.1 hypothetical protein [Entomospira culicis]WDI37212.1 ABC transporter substrate-binding protein [Entomospira culicis]WDI38840.1 ABC transporter substrate-binding protein [Entomospira culicis]
MRRFRVLLWGLLMVVSCRGGQERASDRLLRVAITIEPETTNPLQMTSADVIALFDNVFDALLRYDVAGRVHPHLAKEWQAFEENQRFLFHLRDDVIFHHGELLTAKDVVHTYQTYAQYSSRFALVESVEALDTHIVEIRLRESSADFLNLVATTWIFSASEGENPHSGTGAYRFVRYDAGRVVRLERFDDSFLHEAGLSYFEAVDFIIIKESAGILLGLRSGAIDLAVQIDPTSLDNQMVDALQVILTPQNLTVLLAMNHRVAPFNDKRVRQALNHAIDKERLINLLFNGEAERLDTGMSPVLGAFYHHGLANFYPYNPEKAQELLQAAGYHEQNPLRFRVHVPSNYAIHLRNAEILATQLSAVGVVMEIEAIEWASWLSEVYQGGKYQATIVGLTGKLSAYQQLVRYSQQSQTAFTGFTHQGFEESLHRALRSTSFEEEVVAYHEAQAILAQEAVALFLFDPWLAAVMRKDLRGWQMYPLRTFRVREYSLA